MAFGRARRPGRSTSGALAFGLPRMEGLEEGEEFFGVCVCVVLKDVVLLKGILAFLGF